MKKITCALVGLTLTSSAFAASSPHFNVKCTEVRERGHHKGEEILFEGEVTNLGTLKMMSYLDQKHAQDYYLTLAAPGCEMSDMVANRGEEHTTVEVPVQVPVMCKSQEQTKGGDKCGNFQQQMETKMECHDEVKYTFSYDTMPSKEAPKACPVQTQVQTQTQSQDQCQTQGFAQQSQDQCGKQSCEPINPCDMSKVSVSLLKAKRKFDFKHYDHEKISRNDTADLKTGYHPGLFGHKIRTECTVTFLGEY